MRTALIPSGSNTSHPPRPNEEKWVAVEMACGPEHWLTSGEENVGYAVCFGYERAVLALSAQTISCELIKNDLMFSNMAC